MIYQINIAPDKESAVLKIIRSLQEAGLVESIEPLESLAMEGEPLTDDELILVLEQRREEMIGGVSLSHEEVQKLVKVWKSIRQK